MTIVLVLRGFRRVGDGDCRIAGRSSKARCVVAVALASVLAGSFGAHDARADPTPPGVEAPPAEVPLEAPVFVAYDLPATCPPIGDFERDVAQRAPRARFTTDAAARQFRIAAWQEEAEWVGELTAIPVIDASSVRRVRGATCSDVVGALALIVALALDPGALQNSGGATAGAASQGVPAEAPPPPPPVAVPPPVPRPAPGPAPDLDDDTEPAPQRRWRLSLGAGALAALGIAPGTLFGAGISADVTPARDRLVTWLVRLSASDLFPRDLGAPLKARFSGQFLALEGCPVRLPLGAVVSLLPCVGVEAGVIDAEGISQPRLVATQNQNALFIAIMEPLRLALRLGEVFSLEVDGTLREPLRHDSFGYSRPPVRVHTVPAVTGSFGLGFRVNLDFL